ncbi:MAG: PEP-CTERM sorting domain-containing protein [Methylococcaceae bacterium]|nr:PEP-CTERM sorting domain-containing protein [Methylococcaceae bacterium]MDP3902767.1 PEP-CTERM sorting domain-containing protein [Methylococcaceae bacterium]
MKTSFQLTAITVLLGVSGISQAALTSTTGPVSFSGSASVTATGGQAASATNSNNGATIANVALGQFDGANGVLTGVDLQLTSNRAQTINGSGNKNNGPARTVNGSGSSSALLSGAGVSASFAPNLTQAGTGCTLAHGPTGPVNCTWGPNTAAAATTDTTVGADEANLNDYAGGGSVNASLSLPTLSATTTMSATQGQPGSGSTATYKVDWSGSLQANYSYLLHALASFDGSSAANSLTLDFGTVAQNSSSPSLSFSLFNQANADRIGLDLDSVIGSGDTSSFSTDLSAVTGLAQGSSQAFLAGLLTSATGAFNAQYLLNLSDADLGASNTRQNYQLTLNLVGNVAAVPVPAAVWSFLTGLMGMLALVRRKKSA